MERVPGGVILLGVSFTELLAGKSIFTYLYPCTFGDMDFMGPAWIASWFPLKTATKSGRPNEPGSPTRNIDFQAPTKNRGISTVDVPFLASSHDVILLLLSADPEHIAFGSPLKPRKQINIGLCLFRYLGTKVGKCCSGSKRSTHATWLWVKLFNSRNRCYPCAAASSNGTGNGVTSNTRGASLDRPLGLNMQNHLISASLVTLIP